MPYIKGRTAYSKAWAMMRPVFELSPKNNRFFIGGGWDYELLYAHKALIVLVKCLCWVSARKMSINEGVVLWRLKKMLSVLRPGGPLSDNVSGECLEHVTR